MDLRALCSANNISVPDGFWVDMSEYINSGSERKAEIESEWGRMKFVEYRRLLIKIYRLRSECIRGNRMHASNSCLKRL